MTTNQIDWIVVIIIIIISLCCSISLILQTCFICAGEIYWTDTEIDVIQKATPDGAHVEMVISEGLDMADGIVIDSTGRKVLSHLDQHKEWCVTYCKCRLSAVTRKS